MFLSADVNQDVIEVNFGWQKHYKSALTLILPWKFMIFDDHVTRFDVFSYSI